MSRFRTGLSPTNEGTLVEAIRRLHHRRRPRRRDFLVGSAGACLAAAAWPAAAVTQLRSVAEFGAHGDGVADDTAAFAEALANSAVVYVPSGDYRVGRLRIPNGRSLISFAPLQQPAAPPSARPRLLPADETAILDVEQSRNIRLEGLLFDGEGTCQRAIHGECWSFTASDCNFHGFRQYAAAGNGSGGFVHESHWWNCQFFNCGTASGGAGLTELVDSWVFGCMFTLGGDGLNLPPGANQNHIVGCRFEWTASVGLVANSAEDNVVVGSTFDRCSSFGSVVKGRSNIAFSGCNFFRNSRNDSAETDHAHVYLDGPISAMFAAINTKYGRDDDGSGPLSPRHSLAWGPDADSALVSFTASNLRGYTQSVQTGRPSASLRFAGSFT